MNTSIQHPELNGIVQSSGDSSQSEATLSAWRKLPGRFTFAALLAGLLLLLFSAPAAAATLPGTPPGCNGSALGIFLYTPSGDSHVGCQICYSVLIFNGGPGPLTVCDASNIQAFVTTPDGVTTNITSHLLHTYMTNGQSDFYPSIACYTIRAQDIRPDGTVRATAQDIAIILQNDTPSASTNEQGVNTEVSLPCIKVTAQCIPSVGEIGPIIYTGTVTNCGNNTLFNVTVNSSVTGTVTNILVLNIGQVVSFSGFWVPANPCTPSTNTFTAQGSDSFTNCPPPLGIISSTSVICTNTLTPGIKVTKTCSVDLVPPGFSLNFFGSVSNSGNVTLTNIVVVNNQPSNNTPVFTLASLAPGATAPFNGSYPAPTNCSVTDTLTARASSVCGVVVTNTDTKTCQILTTPQIAVTALCPTAQVVPGGSLIYSVTVQNTGYYILTNISVFSDQPGPNPVKIVASLAPGASTNFNVGPYTVPANACWVSNTFSATGKDLCTSATATNTAPTAICQVITTPGIGVKLNCPASPAVAGGLIIYTGTVTNSGNVILNPVNVLDGQSGTLLSMGPLSAHASAPFTVTNTAPTNACSVSDTVTVMGYDNCTGFGVTNTASTTNCTLITTPGIIVTKFCPDGRVRPGQPFIFTGSVSNSGNITLTNIVVVNNQPSNNTPVFTQSSLAPGAVTNFYGTYLTPTNCSATDTLIATGRSICGVAVSSTNSATCTILTTPLITVTALCPTSLVVPGGTLTYSVMVTNTGDITLTNVVVFSDRPVPNTVLTLASLAPGVSTNFNVTYSVPADACMVTTTFSVSGTDCTPLTATNNFTLTCTVFTTPNIGVNLNCPTLPAVPGGLIIYTGTVTNSGNVILNGVTVVDGQSGTVLPMGSLSVHASAPFTVTNTAPTNACSVSDTVTVTGYDNCTRALVTNTASTTNCPLNTTPGIKVTKSCPGPDRRVAPGQTFTFSGSVSNTGNITLTNIVVVNNQPVSNTVVFTLASLAPGAVTNFTASYAAPTNCSVTDTLIATGRSICGIAVSSTNSATCPILTTPAIVVTTSCPTNLVGQGGLLTYSGTVSNAGNITLTNIIVVNYWPFSNVIFTAASLAPGATTNFTGSYLVPLNCCEAWVWVKASGQGCDGFTVTDIDSRTCTVFTSPNIVITKVCTAGVLRSGDLLTYSGTVSNAGNITLVNVTVLDNQPAPNTFVIGSIILAPGETAGYTGSYIVPPDFCGGDTVTASGQDACSYLFVTNSATATCPIITTPRIGVSKQCPPQPTQHGGQLTFSGTVTNMGNVTLTNVFVVNNQPSNNTPVIGPITLAPGGFLNFTGSYTAPLVCCEMIDTLTARGQDRCSGSTVTATATAICPMLYTPGIALVSDQPCPTNLLPGSVYEFSGFVTNTGDAILTNVTVFSSGYPCQLNGVSELPSGAPLDGFVRPPLLGPLTLAPGQAELYSGCLIVPPNVCEVTVTVTSQDTCASTLITNTISCPVAVTLGINLTEVCYQEYRVSIGDSVIFGGLVCNTSTVPLNIVLFSGQPSIILPSPITLDPGACAPFTGSYIALGGYNPTTNSIIVTNAPGSITTNTGMFVDIHPPLNPPTGQVTNLFEVGTNLNGLTYYDGSLGMSGYFPTLFYSIRHFDSSDSMLTIIKTFVAPHTSPPPTVGMWPVGIRNYDALAWAAPQITGGSSLSFYYLRHDVAGLSYFGYIIAGGAYADMFPPGSIGTNFDALTFAAPNAAGQGANLFYYLRHDGASNTYFGYINPDAATAATAATDLFNFGKKINYMTFSVTDVGYGPTNQFYYLRYDTNGNTVFGTIDADPAFTGTAAARAVDQFTLTNHYQELEFTPTDVGYGPNLFYSIQGGDILTTNNNTFPTYTTNNVIRFTPTNTVMAIGTDICQDSVTAAADCVGPIVPIVLDIGITNGPNGGLMLSLAFPTQSGRSYYVVYKDALTDPDPWIILSGPTAGTGGILTIPEPLDPGQPSRFYRIMITTP